MKAYLIGGAIAALATGIAIAQPAPPPPPGVAQGTAPAPLPPRAPRPPRALDGDRAMHMQVMSDHVMTRDEVAAHVRKMFERLDTNHDGYVSRQEADAFGGKMEAMRAKMDGARQRMEKVRFNIQYGESTGRIGDRGALFDKLDANHDGVISRQEFMNGRAQMRENRVIVMRGNTDGMHPVSPMRPMRMHGMSMSGGSMGFGGRLFEMADTDHDGRVSLQEAEAVALAHFDRADLNHDGRITPDERQRVRTIRIERRPS
jgi:Ca2+-binding EF-hand superfamily protein